MTSIDKPLDFLWFIPSSGDGSYLGTDFLSRDGDPGYYREIAQAADRLGYSGVEDKDHSRLDCRVDALHRRGLCPRGYRAPSPTLGLCVSREFPAHPHR